MVHHNQLPLNCHITHMFVNCKINLYMVGIYEVYPNKNANFKVRALRHTTLTSTAAHFKQLNVTNKTLLKKKSKKNPPYLRKLPPKGPPRLDPS